MIKPLSKIVLLVAVLTMMSACGNSKFYHQNFMRGQVVSFEGNDVVICIGSNQVQLEGKRLSVYRIVYVGGENLAFDGFSRKRVGSMVVDSIIDEHFARATVVEGQIGKYDMVELSR